jgi:acyl transferase domain-containing protein/thioesterase domain-containing protein
MQPIAIVGLACRFPGATTAEAFWRMLVSGNEAIRQVPADRWDVDALYDPNPAAPGKTTTRWGGFLSDIDLFDADFFGISATEAERMDPQQRLILEVAWEALENANIVPSALAGTRTGVFIGISHSDYDRLIYQDYRRISSYHGTSTYHCIAANRLSYLLDLRGPSVAVDTACSSSLVAAHLACQSLRDGECDLAIAGGVNLILTPEETIGLSRCGLMALDGRCKTFDQMADGYVRGEGCGIVVLERPERAGAAGHRTLATIRGSAVNQNGASNGLIAPNGTAQQALFRLALANSAAAPSDIGYVEAHGTGTLLGDSIEFRALQSALEGGHESTSPCYVGSVKTNIGHLEAASGVASLIKVVLALQYASIPPHRNLQRLSPHISTDKRFVIPIDRLPWPSGSRPRRAMVTALGFGGTNCQLILENGESGPTKVAIAERPMHLLTMSAKTPQALKDLAAHYLEFLAETTESIGDITFTANTARSHFGRRAAVVAESHAMLRRRLEAIIEGRSARGSAIGQVTKLPKVAFIFDEPITGKYATIADLLRTEPVFRDTVGVCDAALQDQGQDSFDHRPAREAGDLPDDRPGLAPFVAQYALARLWQSWGIRPAALIAREAGQYVAQCVAGVLSVEETILRILSTQIGSAQAAPNELATVVMIGDQLKLLDGRDKTTVSRILHPSLSSAMRDLVAQGIDLFIDVGGCRLVDGDGIEIGTAASDEDRSARKVWEDLLSILSQLYVRGTPVQWDEFHRSSAGEFVTLPTYPFQRRRYWFSGTTIGERFESPLIRMLITKEFEPLIRSLNASGAFSEAECMLLPKLLQAMLAEDNWYSPESTSLSAKLAQMSQQDRQSHLAAYLRTKIATIAGSSNASPEPELHSTLAEIGLSSKQSRLELQAQVEHELGIELRPGSYKGHTSLAALASQLARMTAQDPAGTKCSPLLLLRTGRKPTPLFLVHAIGGSAAFYRELVLELSDDRRIYALEPRGAIENRMSSGVETMARHFLDAVIAAEPYGPYCIAGWSVGGIIGYEIAKQLAERTQQAVILSLFGRVPPETAQACIRWDPQTLLESVALELGMEKECLRRILAEAGDLARGIATLFSTARLSQLLPSEFTLAQLYRSIGDYRLILQALGRYRPTEYRGPVMQFATEHNETILDGKGCDWAAIYRGPVAVHSIPGENSPTMFGRDNLRRCALVLKHYLDVQPTVATEKMS